MCRVSCSRLQQILRRCSPCLRCLIETRPSESLLDELLTRAEEVATVWGDAVPPAIREASAHKVAHRLYAAGLIRPAAAAA